MNCQLVMKVAAVVGSSMISLLAIAGSPDADKAAREILGRTLEMKLAAGRLARLPSIERSAGVPKDSAPPV